MTEKTAANPDEKVWEQDYQPTDLQGNPIGQKTHLGPFDTPEELIEAQQKQIIAAVRGYHQLKTTIPPTPKKAAWAPKQLSDQESFDAALEIQDPAKARGAVRRLTGVEELEGRFKQLDEVEARMNRRSIALQWARLHLEDFFDCDANGRIIADYLDANNLEWTLENLDAANEATADKQATRPVASAPVVPVTEANPSPARRPSTPDLVPGQFTGARNVKKGLSKADYLRMGRENPAEYNRHFTNTKLRAEMDRVLNGK